MISSDRDSSSVSIARWHRSALWHETTNGKISSNKIDAPEYVLKKCSALTLLSPLCRVVEFLGKTHRFGGGHVTLVPQCLCSKTIATFNPYWRSLENIRWIPLFLICLTEACIAACHLTLLGTQKEVDDRLDVIKVVDGARWCPKYFQKICVSKVIISRANTSWRALGRWHSFHLVSPYSSDSAIVHRIGPSLIC